jgi:DNA repair protein RecN (Recombination protein N)
MLKQLSIRNFAIIDDLNISFSPGLTVLSGETGAGKSIILQAVGLLLGARANSQMIRTGAKTAELEAFFELPANCPAEWAMKSKGYDPSEGLLIRRIISKTNKHQIFINDHRATAASLNAITPSLASISGQHAYQSLLKEEHHLQLLDQFGELVPLQQKLKKQFENLLPMVDHLNELKALADRQAEQSDYLRFQENEILSARISPGEDVRLEKEKEILKNAHHLHQTLAGCEATLYADQGAVMERLTMAAKALTGAGKIDPALGQPAQQLSELAIQVEEVVQGLRGYMSGMDADPGRLDTIEDRLDLLQRLKRKHGGTLEAVCKRLRQIQSELMQITTIADQIASVEEQIDQQHAAIAQSAESLSHKRRSAAQKMGTKVAQELAHMHMAGTRFEVVLGQTAAEPTTNPFLRVKDARLSETGIDQARFYIAPNVGETVKPLKMIASGGELSRIILALKVILAQNDAVESIVFDEVDTGIGGGTAEAVGQKLAALASHHQVICITHLPQIAVYADHHYRIVKRVAAGRAKTTILETSGDDRIKEIARMLGGREITDAAMVNALEMLTNASVKVSKQL